MAVRYRPVFLGVVGPGAVTTTVYTVPADRTLVLKRARFQVTAGTGALQVLVNRPGVTQVLVGAITPTAAGTVYAIDVDDLVLVEGDQLQVFVGAGTTVRALVSGSLLEGDPA